MLGQVLPALTDLFKGKALNVQQIEQLEKTNIIIQEQGLMFPQGAHKEGCNAVRTVVAQHCICPQHYVQSVPK